MSDDEFDNAMYRLARVCYLAGWAAREAQSSPDPPLDNAEAGWKSLEIELMRQFSSRFSKHQRKIFH
jgi:hypothetical protein